MAHDARQQAEKRGHRGEWLAAWALRLKGYRIVATRFKTKAGEVDIIARKKDLIIMVEVKARATLLEAMDSITPTALRRIENAGDIWLAKQPDFAKLSIRYDMVAVLPGKWPVHVERIFDGGGR
ncbi:MAG: YraN family protein [Rhizobiaceae bacterium]